VRSVTISSSAYGLTALEVKAQILSINCRNKINLKDVPFRSRKWSKRLSQLATRTRFGSLPRRTAHCSYSWTTSTRVLWERSNWPASLSSQTLGGLEEALQSPGGHQARLDESILETELPSLRAADRRDRLWAAEAVHHSL
jgi:hypothetical protein